MHIKKKRLAFLICSVLGIGFIAPPAIPVDSAFAASNDEIKFPIIDEYGDYKNGANYPNSYNVVKYDTFYEPTQISPSKTTTVQEDGWVTGGPEYKDGYTVNPDGSKGDRCSMQINGKDVSFGTFHPVKKGDSVTEHGAVIRFWHLVGVPKSTGGSSGSSCASGEILKDGKCVKNPEHKTIYIKAEATPDPNKANIGLDNINGNGKQVIRDIAKGVMKDSGINTDGSTVIINKPLETKEIHVDGTITTTGDIEDGGNLHVKKDTTLDGNLDVGGDTRIRGNTEIDKDLTVHGGQTVDGDSTIHGDQTIDKDLHVKGDTTLDGDLDVNGDTHLQGNTEIDKDLTIHGDQTVDGDSIIHGNQTIDKDFHVKGDTTLDGKLDVGGDTHLHGNTEIDKDLTVHGSQTVDGDSTIHGNQTIDKDLMIDGNAEIDKDLKVKGNARVDGDIYGQSFSIGNEHYIDKDGLNANNHRITNVIDGEISETSLDAINGSQLYDTSTKLRHNINQVGAQAAAMANLHPINYNSDNKLSVAAAVGSYRDQQAFAFGAFYRPNENTIISASGALGNKDNMVSVGVSRNIGKNTAIDPSNGQLRDKISELSQKNTSLESKIDEASAAYETLLKTVGSLEKQVAEVNGNDHQKPHQEQGEESILNSLR